MEQIFIYLAIILAVAFIISYLVRFFKQPILIGYIIAGMIVSPFILDAVKSNETINIFSELGIAFLLFVVGLHLNPRVIKQMGFKSIVLAAVQMALTFVAGFLFSFYILDYTALVSSFIGIAIMFSSTIIVVKLILDKKQIDSLYSKIAIAILILQDVVAVLVLIFISSSAIETNYLGSSLLLQAVYGFGLLVVLGLFGWLVVPRITKKVADSQELLFLFAILWCFVCGALFAYFGFSIEIGALLAGILISASPYSVEISSRIKPLRDFFLIIFFIILGLNMPITNVGNIALESILLSIVVLIIKPLIVIITMSFLGYTRMTNLMTGVSLAQISEFSIIILILANQFNLIDARFIQVIAFTLIITTIFSTYMIMYSDWIYSKLSFFLKKIERKDVKLEKKIKSNYDVILFGYNRIGFNILRSLKDLNKKYLVVDFNPEVIASLKKHNIPCVYGDAYDVDLLEDLPLETTQLVISTIPGFQTNKLLIQKVKQYNPNAIIIVRSHHMEGALELYKAGANYVLTPHFLGGEYVAKMILNEKFNQSGYEKERKDHIEKLKERIRDGEEYPGSD